MDQNPEINKDFESLLMTRTPKKHLALYTSSAYQNTSLNHSKTGKLYSAKDVLANVSKQLRAIQNADTASNKRVGNKLDKYKKREFLPINMIPMQKEVPIHIPTKFETQCVTDTQLINVIENAEIVDRHGGVTQEFDETFCQKSDEDDCDIKLNEGSLKPDIVTNASTDTKEHITSVDRIENDDLNDQDSKLFENSGLITCEMDTVTCYPSDIITDLNEEIAINTSHDTPDFNKCVVVVDESEDNEERSKSPVLNTVRNISPAINRKNDTPPLVVSLYSFEKFEDLAYPIIEEHEDLDIAKNLINSQIIGREILIPDHIYGNNHRESPILNRMECITTNINKGDFANIDTGDNKCINSDTKNTKEPISGCLFHSDSFTENKKPESKIVKLEFKDEILFSSDEEYEYLHKEVQELPLTCALETSFYDKSDVLDTTMYVGFQTASNKSIQIHTDSFTKARSILCDIDNEETGTTLKELVEIFDSGKAVNENVKNIQLASYKQEHDIDNKSIFEIEQEAKKDLTRTSANPMELEEGISDTFKNISLTALEQNNDNNDEILMSQVIEFKSSSRPVKVNNSIIFEETISDTINNVGLTALEKNIQIDDDVIMSQVIEFKSIARTPNSVTNVCNASSSNVFKNPNEVITKRKFEGFKTASNKKIKLSDKALARCKKVFQDIDLDDTEDVDCKSNLVGAKGNFNSNFKLYEPNLSFNGLKASSEINSASRRSDNNIGDKLSLDIATNSYCQSKANVEITNKEKQHKIEDVDLQINDKIILQEFEDNEMPFEETNNNAYTGFKTASDKDIVISDSALAKTKHLFQDIMTINTENDSDKGINGAETSIDNIDQYQNVFKNPVTDLKIVRNKPNKTSNETLAIADILVPEEKEKINVFRKPSTSNFIGFKTAANKEIVISEQARENTKDFYKNLDEELQVNIDKEENNKSDMAKKIGNRVEDDFNCGIDTQDFLADELTRIEDFFKDDIVENKKSTSPIFQGFQTASRKAVVISKQALEKGKKLFEDITNKDCDTKCRLAEVKSIQKDDAIDKVGRHESDDKYVQPESNDDDSQYKCFLTDTDQNLDKPNNMKNETPIFKGFQTEFKVIEASRKLFQDILFDPNQNNTQMETSTDLPSQILDISTENTKRLIGKCNLEGKSREPIFIGFKTASAKPIPISADAIEKTKRILKEFDLKNDDDMLDNNYEQLVDPKPSTDTFVGFQTASKKKIEISAKALAKGKQMLNDFELKDDFNKIDKQIENVTNRSLGQYECNGIGMKKDMEIDNPNAPPTNKFVGFKTASNNEVKISNEAMARSNNIFQDVYISENDRLNEGIAEQEKRTSPVFKSFQTAINKKATISEKSLKKSKKLFHDIDAVDYLKDDKHDSTPVFRGFQTASNKRVEISEKALAKSKRLFEDINLSQLDKDQKTTPVMNDLQETNVNNDVIQSEEEPLVNVKENNFKGFQTASNKKVSISDKALEKSKKLFHDIDTDRYVNEKRESVPAFRGFQTASNKKVEISEKALAKSKQLFEDLNLSQFSKESKKTSEFNDLLVTDEPIVNDSNFKGFQTASNKQEKISEPALSKIKDIFKDIHEENNIATVEVEVKNTNERVRFSNNIIKLKPIETGNSNVINKEVIDTQVINDFQDTLNTEDFCKSTPTSKRSGSPILSCPRAKKRKFETPYRNSKKIEIKNAFVPPKVSKTYIFDDTYKKHKKYTLKDVEKLEKEYIKIDADPYISEFNFDRLLNIEFFNARNDYTEGKFTIEKIKKTFLDSVNKKIVPDGWLDNHIKLILWKLLSYEVKFPNAMKNICTVRNVLKQLKYRYDRELYHVQRPILRKVLEKDEVASKTMVLCVVAIYVDNISVTSVPPTAQSVEFLLTDGWYCVKACTDRLLVRLAANGAIVVGTKDTSSVRLKLSGNSVRRARWLAQLGPRAGVARCPLRAARPDGGRLAATQVLVTRVYPPLYVEKMDDGSTVTLSERLEHIRQMKYESERQAVMEKLYEEIEKEMSDQDSQDSEGCSNERICLDSGSQISRCMKKSKDPDEYRSHLTKSQNRMLEEHSSKQREKLIERARVRFQQKLEKNGLKTERNVVPLLKVRVAGLTDKGGEVTKGYLSVWKPSAAVLELVREGSWIEILNVIPTGIRNSEIQLSAGRQTVFNPYKQTNDKFKPYTNSLKRKCYEIKELSQNPTMTTDYNEIDTVGMIFSIEPSTKEFEKQNFQNVYLADADKNIICVNFWGGLKKIGFENVLDTGQIVTCVNLQKRVGNTRKSIPEYRVTEFSYFTKTPKDKKALEITNELSNKLSKIRDKFCEDCVLLKNNYAVFKTRNNENVSPYRLNYNIPRNMVSPLRSDANLNLTGLDFESNFDSQEISPQALLRKKKVNEKIEKIRLNYGEPPPLSSIHIINKSKNASATYKSPLISNLERYNVASVETPNAIGMSMNRTYVKNVNPVKLIFSSASNLDDDVDHFAEDFDASPPLSLDSDTVN